MEAAEIMNRFLELNIHCDLPEQIKSHLSELSAAEKGEAFFLMFQFTAFTPDYDFMMEKSVPST